MCQRLLFHGHGQPLLTSATLACVGGKQGHSPCPPRDNIHSRHGATKLSRRVGHIGYVDRAEAHVTVVTTQRPWINLLRLG